MTGFLTDNFLMMDSTVLDSSQRCDSSGIGDEAAAVHDGHIEDLNGDIYDDMVLHFREGELGIPTDTADNTILDLFLTGELNDGRAFEGTDVVRITPNNPNSRGKGGKGLK